jgi:hypothetical protein
MWTMWVQAIVLQVLLSTNDIRFTRINRIKTSVRHQDIGNINKLRTYITFKKYFCTEKYVNIVTNRQHRSILAQFRCGVLPLKVETGRFQNIPLEYRLCTLCDQDVLETESHFPLFCNSYAELRYTFFC